MKKILVPTDFSNAAKDAFTYAIHFASEYNGSIHLLHAYRQFVSPNAPVVIVPPENHSAEYAKNFMDNFVSGVREQLSEENLKVPITEELVLGFARDEIAERSKKGRNDFIVMGKTGENSIADKLFGSVTTATIQRAHCPILAVPEGANYKGFHKILFATNLLAIDKNIIHEVIEFALKFKATVYFVHVNNNDEIDGNLESELFEKIFEAFEEPPIPFEIKTVTGETVEEGLNTFTKGNDIDLLIMVTEHKTLWERLFNKSHTKQMALQLDIPLLILHADDDLDL